MYRLCLPGRHSQQQWLESRDIGAMRLDNGTVGERAPPAPGTARLRNAIAGDTCLYAEMRRGTINRATSTCNISPR